MHPRRPRRSEITFRGAAAILALVALVVVPHLLARPLSAQEAQRRVHDHLVANVSRELVSGNSDPLDSATAERWRSELVRVRDLRFRSVEVRRAVVAPPFRRRTNYAVKAVVADEKGRERTLYFWLFASDASSVDESSRLWWSAPV